MNDAGAAKQAKPQRQSQVSEQSVNVSGAISRLTDTISEFEDKLPRVLRNDKPGEGVTENDEDLVSLAADLRVNASDINTQTNRLRSMIDRMEL